MRALTVAALIGLAVGCGEPAPLRNPAGLPNADPSASAAGSAEEPAPAPADGADLSLEIEPMLARVAKARALAPKHPVQGERLDRKRVIELIMAKTEKELPQGVLEAQGEMLRALGLIQPEYDFAGGIYELIQQNLAGYYDQHVDKMFILDDLPQAAVDETLAHELVHALQDQHFDLTALLTYRPGDSDRVTAGHALAEGDAMSAMFELTHGDARKVSVTKLRVAMVASVAFSPSGASTPRVLQASLIAPYVDGFRFVQELRERGGWAAVDAAYAQLPISTEQLLHLDKYLANEQPVALVAPKLPAGFEQQDHDVLGEQGLRMVLEQWASNDEAALGAAGWGGDRFAIGKREVSGGADWTTAWHLVFDTPEDAHEAGALLKKWHQASCVERTDLGPLAWRQDGPKLAIVAGPFRKTSAGKLSSQGSCKGAATWLAEVLAQR